MDACCICKEMRALQNEQKLLSEFGKNCRYIVGSKQLDTIPFMLITAEGFEPFTAILHNTTTPFFRLESIENDSCCAQLTLLKAVDMMGRPSISANDLYSLEKTDRCIHLKLCCFIAINPMPANLVSKPLPTIEMKV
ncbi:CotY/CotZ family spore coat protein [Sporosarcina oncorhynchi]|uniref:CotY/CotZ family spore coat protein n=1 Tax=Sporosarcina oncorhynchi TaxID=3056444 RepID=A0ABZ0L918_9BACL|nr:CotY/CotZ family spore coat protein [Sporosarcina sp. T2O-4]WOV89032.1 CotY/CotZ family spore coat protein [Sporosarcina sp. T2O-4]